MARKIPDAIMTMRMIPAKEPKFHIYDKFLGVG
jgi:hypothetical protein